MKKICYLATIPMTIRAFFIPQLKLLAENGYDVTVVCKDDGSIADELGDNIRFYGIDMPRGISVRGSLKAYFKLKAFFKSQKFDIIQYSTPNVSMYSALAATMTGCKIRNYHLMGYKFLGSSGPERLLLKTIEKVTCKLSTSIECVSKSNLELGVKEKLFKRGKATVVWNGSTGGVDLKRFDISKREEWRKELRLANGFSEDDFVFGFVGRITRDKGINELLEAFLNLNCKSKLYIVGNNENDGTVNSALWEKASSSPDVTIHPLTTEIEKYYAMIDALVLPSYREGFGNVIIEAAAVGTPAIITNIPGPVDAVEVSKTALLATPKDADDLRQKMQQIMNADYKAMGSYASEFVKKNFDGKELCKRILERKQSLL